MTYIYDGILTEDVLNYVRQAAGKYPRAIEVSTLPDHTAFDAAYAHRTYQFNGENCMGQAYTNTRQGVAYCYVQKNFGVEPGGFLFLPDDEACAVFLVKFPDLIVNLQPFKTQF